MLVTLAGIVQSPLVCGHWMSVQPHLQNNTPSTLLYAVLLVLTRFAREAGT